MAAKTVVHTDAGKINVYERSMLLDGRQCFPNGADTELHQVAEFINHVFNLGRKAKAREVRSVLEVKV